jgi:hypothetical protein
LKGLQGGDGGFDDCFGGHVGRERVEVGW